MEFLEGLKKANKICNTYKKCTDCILGKEGEYGNYCLINYFILNESNCDFEKTEKIISEWEPPVDWSKVGVDTPILVWNDESKIKSKRYFSRYANGRVFAWMSGTTSWSVPGDMAFPETAWQHAELAEVEND